MTDAQKPPTKKELFLELAKPDAQGFSRKVPVTEFVGRYAGLALGNGAGWSRSDGGIGTAYNVVRHKEGKGNGTTHIELQGFNVNPKKRPISKKVRDALKGKPCVVLGVGRVQIDHKNGRYNNAGLTDTANQNADEFQPLSECVNYAKRQHCKRCAATGKRFDATTLGYTVAQVKGNGTYHGTCVGCYWYDPQEFNAALALKPKETENDTRTSE